MPKVQWNAEGAEKIIASWEQISGKVRQGKDATKDLERAQQELGRIAQQTIRQNTTAQERFAEGIKRVETLVKAEKLSVADLTREVTRLRMEYLREADANPKRAAAALAAANQRIAAERASSAALVAETKRAEAEKLNAQRAAAQAATQIIRQTETAQERYNRRIAEATKLYRAGSLSVTEYRRVTQRLTEEQLRTERAGHGVAKANAIAFGSQAVSNLARFALSAVGIQQIYSSIRSDLEATAAAGERLIASAERGRELAQLLSGSTKEEFAKGLQGLKGEARKTYLEGVFETEGEARGLQFELVSGGLEREREFFSRVAAIADPTELAKTIGVVRQGFGRKEAGTAEQLTSKAVAASAPAPGVSLGQHLSALASVAELAGQLGYSDEETQAFLSLVEERTGEAGEAGTIASGLFTSLIVKGYADKGRRTSLANTLADIRTKGMAPSELKRYFGRKEAMRGFLIAGQSEAAITSLSQRQAEIERAQSALTINEQISAALAESDMATLRFVRSRKAAADVADESQSLLVQRQRAAFERESADIRAWAPPFISGPMNLIRSIDESVENALGITPDPAQPPRLADTGFAKGARRVGRALGLPIQDESHFAEMARNVQRTAESTERQERLFEEQNRQGVNYGRQE